MKFVDGDRKVSVKIVDNDIRCRADAYWGWKGESEIPFLSESGPNRTVAIRRITEALQAKGFTRKQAKERSAK